MVLTTNSLEEKIRLDSHRLKPVDFLPIPLIGPLGYLDRISNLDHVPSDNERNKIAARGALLGMYNLGIGAGYVIALMSII